MLRLLPPSNPDGCSDTRFCDDARRKLPKLLGLAIRQADEIAVSRWPFNGVLNFRGSVRPAKADSAPVSRARLSARWAAAPVHMCRFVTGLAQPRRVRAAGHMTLHTLEVAPPAGGRCPPSAHPLPTRRGAEGSVNAPTEKAIRAVARRAFWFVSPAVPLGA